MSPSRAPGAPGTKGIEVRPLEAERDAERDALVAATPGGSVFHLAPWRAFLERNYGFPSLELGAFRDDRLVGVLPLMECPGLLGRRLLLSVPFAVYGGPVAADPVAREALVEAACALAEERRAGRLELRCEESCGERLVGGDLYATFRRALPEDPGEVLARMPKKARAVARQARERHGLVLAEGTWYLEDLVRLFLLNKRALGSPALPPEHFRSILAHLEDRTHVHVVRHERQPVAAVMSFAFGDTLLAYYAGTEPGADRALGASNFLYMALQEWAVERGFRAFDFSRSRRDSGAFRFKVHQGFEPSPLAYRYHLVRDRRPPSFTPSNPRTRGLRSLWSRLPLWAARRLTRALAPRLP